MSHPIVALRERVPAYTLVELLVSLAVLGVLVGLAIPAMFSARTRARAARSLSDIRQHAVTLNVYVADHDGFLPCFLKDGEISDRPASVGWDPNPSESTSRFATHASWPYLAYASRADAGDSLASPFAPRPFLRLSYYLSCTFDTRPEYWVPETRGGREQLKPSPLALTSSPSRKFLLLDVAAWYDLSATPGSDTEPFGRIEGLAVDRPGGNSAAFVDGSARGVRHAQLRPGYTQGDGLLHPFDWPAGLHTHQGTLGTDIR